MQDLKYLREYAAAMENPCGFIETYFKTFDLTQSRFVPFKLFDTQKELILNMATERFNIATKPRQAGVSTTVAAYAAVILALSPSTNPEKVVVAANKLATAQEFLDKVRGFAAQIPSVFWGEKYQHDKELDGHIVGKGSTRKLQFVNGSVIIAMPNKPDALRGHTPTLLIIDEAAFIERGDEMYSAAMAATSTGGKVTLISTPNGFDRLYYQVYNKAKSGDNGFKITEFKWYYDPRYNKDLIWQKKSETGELLTIKESIFDKKHLMKRANDGWTASSSWYRTQVANSVNKKAVAREYDVKFEGSAGNVIEYEFMDFHRSHYVYRDLDQPDKPAPFLLGEENRIWIWEYPKENCKYIMGVDVASGNADDYSAVTIYNMDTGEQAFEYKAKLRPEALAYLVEQYGLMYKSLTVVDTTGGYGDIVVYELQKRAYPHLYVKNPNRVNDLGVPVAGLKITSENRAKIIGNLVSYVEGYAIKIKSRRMISEMETFVWINNRANHMVGYNDDLIMAHAIMIHIWHTHYQVVERHTKSNEAILNYWLS